MTSAPRAPWIRRAVAGAGIGIAAALLAVGLGRTDLLKSFENKTYDARVKRAAEPARADSPVVIIEIDDATVQALEPVVGRWPWPRMVWASALDYLTRAGARTVAFDVLFGEREGRSETVVNGRTITGDQSDQMFVDAVRRAGNVVLLADATSEGLANASADAAPAVAVPGPAYVPGPGFLARPELQLPFADLAAAAAAVGHNVLERDPGDSARRILPFIDYRGASVPWLGVAAALQFLGAGADDVRLDAQGLRIGGTHVPTLAEPERSASGALLPSRQVPIRFVQPTTDSHGVRSIFPTYSFFDLLLSADQVSSGKPPAIPASAFAGKLVFIGTTAAGLFDRYSTPFDGGAAGVELHAMVADDILAGSFMRRTDPGVDFAMDLVLGLVSALAATLLPVAAAIVFVVALLAAAWAWLVHEIARGVWMAAVAPATAAMLGAFGGVAWQYVVEGREKRHVKQLFGRYVSKDVINQLMVDPSRAALGGERREMSVLFSDIRNFTTATEAGQPEAVVAQLNEYFGEMVAVLFRHQGTLDKFVGDMVMGLFGAPLADAQHADHAVQAALEMMTALDGLNAKWRAEGKPAVDIGIGINSGEMIAGNIGSEAIMSYTVIGDAVNLGSRLESLNKQYHTHILISDATRAALTIAVETRPIGEVTVKGKTHPVMVYEVVRAAGRAAPA